MAWHGESDVGVVVGPGLIIRDMKGNQITVAPDARSRKLRSVRMNDSSPVLLDLNTNGDLWEIGRDGKAEHPTQKPVGLAKRALLNSSETGDIVLDLFLGSGSTLLAAEITDRVCYGMEIDRAYCEATIRRWESLIGKKAEKVLDSRKAKK